MKIVSVILARGGSKGIPKKNIVDLCGKPLIAWTIEASQQSSVHETWISTDDKEIADIADELGVNVLLRPQELAMDTSSSEEALLHFANNVQFDILVFIQPTSPLLLAQDINAGLDLMTKYTSVFSGYKEHWLPRWDDNKPLNWDISNRPRRQDKKEIFIENGAFYITTKQELFASGLRYSGNIGIVEMLPSRSFQIDTNDDLSLVRKLL